MEDRILKKVKAELMPLFNGDVFRLGSVEECKKIKKEKAAKLKNVKNWKDSDLIVVSV